MPISLIGVLPHGTIILDEKAPETSQGFNKFIDILSTMDIDEYIILDPHANTPIDKIAVQITDKYCFSWSGINKKINLSIDVNQESLQNLLKINSEYVQQTNFANISWGAFVPILKLNIQKPVGVLSIGRKLAKNTINGLTQLMIDSLNQLEKNICLLYSCDLSHTHDANNKTFGYDHHSAIYDNFIRYLFSANSIEEYQYCNVDTVKRARTDAHQNLLSLSHICKSYSYSSSLLSYEVPTYFGMLTGVVYVNF